MSQHNNSFRAIVNAMMDNAEGVLTSKTVVGAPLRVGDQVIIPLSDVTIGCGAGSNNGGNVKDSGMGGFSAKMSPTAVLIIKDGFTKVVNIRDSNTLIKLMDMVPEVVEKIKGDKAGILSDEEAVRNAFPEEAETAPEV